ncbi:restriction endonuclease subunit S [Parasphingorhabdus halotolerans]|uniref:Restriction endonuclease subunit S n=1 Tax=Parasphingorhabdus halotolerans TaxID=2725558 RepID=A0A6H2DMH5_9SPHN|nr:restriction endonuclease subunit S [Parasphingorhabdus halotolerans]QJB69869.1 restriction endonuclease subunit S [Parasphingorhabdus halotolerans]
MSWPRVKLCDIANSQYGYTASAQDEAIGPKFLRITDIVPPFIDWDKVPYCPIDEKLNAKYALSPGDIVVARTGATTGHAKLIRSEQNSVFASYLVRFKVHDDRLESGFVGLLVESDQYKNFVNGVKGGSAQPNANAKSLGLFEFAVPPLDVQRRIVEVAITYDDLIENNRRRIALLEEAARLLYREWFVHFRFPGHEHIKIIDGAPEGWKKTKLIDLVDWIKETVKPVHFTEGDVHIGLEHIPRRSFTLADWETTEGLASQKFRFKKGDVIFGKIRPYFHKVGFAICDGLASSDAFIWRPKSPKLWPLVVCATSSDYFVAVASKTVKEGSKMPRADWSVLSQFSIPTPPSGILDDFNAQIEPITTQCASLALANHELVKARDLLLPRLMDGRIEV